MLRKRFNVTATEGLQLGCYYISSVLMSAIVQPRHTMRILTVLLYHGNNFGNVLAQGLLWGIRDWVLAKNSCYLLLQNALG